MSSDKNDQEPSMEEILSSIRRIIADDEDEAAPAKPAAKELPAAERSATPPAAAKRTEPERPPAKPPQPAFDELPDDEENDVLDLTDVVERGGAKQQPSRFDHEAPFDGEADEIDLEPEAWDEEPEPEPEPAPPPRRAAKPKPQPRAERSAFDEDMLVSQAAATASTGAFARLAKAASGSEPPPLAGGDKTVEQFLIELLRPMLKEWLDDNLEGVVERVVEQEVKKLARRAELM